MKAFFLISGLLFCACLNRLSAQEKPVYYEKLQQVIDKVFLRIEPLSGRYFLKTEPEKVYDENTGMWYWLYHLKLENFAGQNERMEQMLGDMEENLKLHKQDFGKKGTEKRRMSADSLFLSKEKPGLEIGISIRINETHFFPYDNNTPDVLNELIPIKLPLAAHAFQVYSCDGWPPKQYGVFYFGKNWPAQLPPKTAHANNRPRYKFRYKEPGNGIENIVVDISGPREITEWFAKNVNWGAIIDILDK